MELGGGPRKMRIFLIAFASSGLVAYWAASAGLGFGLAVAAGMAVSAAVAGVAFWRRVQ